MKITGSSSYIKFDLENGYVLKAEGEMLVGRFEVFKNSMKKWEAPHEHEVVTKEEMEKIIMEVNSNINKNTMQISFEWKK